MLQIGSGLVQQQQTLADQLKTNHGVIQIADRGILFLMFGSSVNQDE